MKPSRNLHSGTDGSSQRAGSTPTPRDFLTQAAYPPPPRTPDLQGNLTTWHDLEGRLPVDHMQVSQIYPHTTTHTTSHCNHPHIPTFSPDLTLPDVDLWIPSLQPPQLSPPARRQQSTSVSGEMDNKLPPNGRSLAQSRGVWSSLEDADDAQVLASASRHLINPSRGMGG